MRGPTASWPGSDKGPSPPAGWCQRGLVQGTAFPQCQGEKATRCGDTVLFLTPSCQGSVADGLVGSPYPPSTSTQGTPASQCQQRPRGEPRALIPLGSHKAAAPLPLPRWCRRKPAETEGLRNVQGQNIIPRTSRFQQKITRYKKWEDRKLNDKRQLIGLNTEMTKSLI